jgi:hypothetical protein
MFDGGEAPTKVMAARAVLAEDLVVASLVLAGRRREFVRRVVGSLGSHLDLHLVRRGLNVSVTSTSAAVREPSGLTIDVRAVSRYRRMGFPSLYDFTVRNTELATRIRAALGWLIQSRTDASPQSALVKTSTALESLLVIGREPPTRALAERAAYLLTDDPSMRQRVSKAALRFYALRGNIVHGKESASATVIENALEFGDRGAVLLSLVLAAQIPAWKSASDVQEYTDRVRWGYAPSCIRPWPRAQLHNALTRIG